MKLVRILVVDDNPMVVNFVRHTLTLWLETACWDYEIVSACDGIRAVELAKAIHPDLIILDFHLPHLNGYEVIQALKPTPPTILMTAAPPLEQVQLAIAACAVYLPKPFIPSLLVHHVRTQLSREKCSIGV